MIFPHEINWQILLYHLSYVEEVNSWIQAIPYPYIFDILSCEILSLFFYHFFVFYSLKFPKFINSKRNNIMERAKLIVFILNFAYYKTMWKVFDFYFLIEKVKFEWLKKNYRNTFHLFLQSQLNFNIHFWETKWEYRSIVYIILLC